MSNSSFTIRPEATASVHDDGVVILHLGNGRFYTCNGTGARIWCAIEQRLSLEAIAQEISRVYEIALNTARQHTVRFVAELELHELIQQEVSL